MKTQKSVKTLNETVFEKKFKNIILCALKKKGNKKIMTDGMNTLLYYAKSMLESTYKNVPEFTSRKSVESFVKSLAKKPRKKTAKATGQKKEKERGNEKEEENEKKKDVNKEKETRITEIINE